MAEPTCVLHPFSYPSPGFSHETTQEFAEQENPAYEMMGESVSLGRFMTESLEWERWSTFNNNNNRNRYVEEAEKYSRPGLVAQKKAYFEAHFKRMAALKAAALLDQESGNNGGEDVRQGGFVVHQNELYSSVAAGPDDGSFNVNDDDHDHDDRDGGDHDAGVDDHVMVKESEDCLGGVKDESSNVESSGSGVSQGEGGAIPLQEEEEASAAIVKKNPPLSSYMSPIKGIGRDPVFASTPARAAATVHPGKENYAIATPMKKKPTNNDMDKKRTPLRASINREFNRILSPVIRKIGSSSKASKDSSTPLKTPAKASVNGTSENPTMTPDATTRGGRSEHKLPGPRWHVLSDGLKSPMNSRSKISSPIIPSSFCLRRERTSRRKQKLEEKFNATAATEKVPPQPSKFKEKAEAELNKFRHSFCFKAMSSPDHYRETESQNSSKRKGGESTGHQSLNQARQPPNTSSSQSRSSLPPRRPSIKSK